MILQKRQFSLIVIINIVKGRGLPSLALRCSLPLLAGTPRNAPESDGPRGVGSLSHFIPSPPPSQKKLVNISGFERGWIAWSLRFPATLRVLASPKSLTAQVHFVHAQSIEPSPRVRTSTHEKIKDPRGALYFFRRERGSNPRSCDRLRFSRPAQSTTLASLRGLGQYSKNPRCFQPKEKSQQLWLQGFPLKKSGLT